LRATHDAILVGSGTVLADDPELTCRLPGLEDRSPVRVVLDGRLRMPLSSKLVTGVGKLRTVLITGRGRKEERQPYKDAGVEVLAVITDEHGHPHPPYVMAALAELGITRVLIEGGAAVAAAYVKAGLVDRIHWFRAPGVIGGDGLASIAEIGLDRAEHMNRFERTALFAAGADTVEIYRKKSS
jgi:diaminohydroxyphosphoribosylaminopyrimidine deaminase/5-amino-6-(5-phosphoribosylamino)uracil reductase